eukprot:CAMPEP_0184648890 /NCGR_PEP_ID=MMETSP0308-20130426/6125_1 /TAXON_ID=38269 /ORGANISM="Gloeochaete witrockiana, Strain SAG 46.84" /LENGTH=155 /DNA_ID=CAMNT_0027081153 /DNA_START=98 /DNA_END=565 /DNA_ORIENTATION=+
MSTYALRVFGILFLLVLAALSAFLLEWSKDVDDGMIFGAGNEKIMWDVSKDAVDTMSRRRTAMFFSPTHSNELLPVDISRTGDLVVLNSGAASSNEALLDQDHLLVALGLGVCLLGCSFALLLYMCLERLKSCELSLSVSLTGRNTPSQTLISRA